ncbi:hypothetical protein NMY22_g1100 [Coprinellus aureogranulatus]|nr:hypothetical protein NMY22_g1100 [Coprinellus aureogranulatus]
MKAVVESKNGTIIAPQHNQVETNKFQVFPPHKRSRSRIPNWEGFDCIGLVTVGAASMASTEGQAQFQRFKAICVPLLGNSKLQPSTIPTVSSLLSQLIQALRELPPPSFTTSLISYVFFPLSSILQRNLSAEIPDQILEKVLIALALLCEGWWWTCELKIWEQIFMLCGAVVGGMESKGKERARDEETKEAAIRCLLALLHERTPQDALDRLLPEQRAAERTSELLDLSHSQKFIPVIGQTIDSVLGTASSTRLSLQRSSLELLALLLDKYAPHDLVPTVLPGVASTMTKISLGIPGNKGWANGEVVASSLKVLRVAIVKSVGDNICMKEGALPRFEDLEDLADYAKTDPPEQQRPSSNAYGTARTPSWLRGTTSQLHIAINTLTPLVKHPTPSALYALVEFSSEVIAATSLTLPQTQSLLLSFLLSLIHSEYPKVGEAALQSLKQLLGTSNKRAELLQALMQMTSQNLASLPHFISSQSDAKIQHAAEIVISVCRIASLTSDDHTLSSFPKQWGRSSDQVGELKNGVGASCQHWNNTWVPFPELSLRTISSREARGALDDLFRALGAVAGDSALYSVEWFASVGQTAVQSRNVAAMWCACRLLEGVGRVSLSSEPVFTTSYRSKRLEKQCRALVRTVSELWDKSDLDDLAADASPNPQGHEELEINVQHQKGLIPLHETLKITRSDGTRGKGVVNQPVLHRGLCLQLISISAGILQSRFSALFIFSLYPIMHSIVSPFPFLSSSGLAALNYITAATSYASPGNLLLSNFDYALDSVSRRLTRRWLDIDATKVLVILVRLVGSDVVAKAGDVVEECFDRLDAYHGYGAIVDGLVEVLTEVLNVIEADMKANPDAGPQREVDEPREIVRLKNLDSLLEWLPRRKDVSVADENDNYGPAPPETWGPGNVEEGEQDEDEEAKIKQQEPSEQPRSPSQALTAQIISRSLYFLTHESPVIRARILLLLALAVPVLPEAALLPSIHNAWPFILNRLNDRETFVVGAAAHLIETLVTDVGSFMYRRIWDDIWPRFQIMLNQLEVGDSVNALARRGRSAVGTESAYTHSHRLYRSILKTMTGVMKGVHPYEPSFWNCLVLFRRFLGKDVHDELQLCAQQFYAAAGKKNVDAVWLALKATVANVGSSVSFMHDDCWKIEDNAREVLLRLDGR